MMPSLRVRLCLVLIWACVLVLLSRCASAPTVVYKDRVVTVPQPILVQPDPRLTADCPPQVSLPASPKVRNMRDRLGAVETALADCRNRMKELRETK